MAPEIRKIAEAKYYENPKMCKECRVVISFETIKLYGRAVFCGHKCSATHNNQRRVLKIRKPCIECGNKLPKTALKFCGSVCLNSYYWKLKTQEIIEGKVIRRLTIKKYLLSIRGHKCEECGLTEWIGRPAPLVLDHIDGNAGNNDLKNLKLLCQNCNAFTPTFTSKNKGKGRGSRGLSLG